jgi:hypothetical protein
VRKVGLLNVSLNSLIALNSWQVVQIHHFPSSDIGLTLPQINNVFLRRDGANNATGDLNMSGRRVLNIPTPTEGQDAANKNFVDQTTVSKTGDTMSGNLILRVANNPSITLGCNDLRGNKRINLLLGGT